MSEPIIYRQQEALRLAQQFADGDVSQWAAFQELTQWFSLSDAAEKVTRWAASQDAVWSEFQFWQDRARAAYDRQHRWWFMRAWYRMANAFTWWWARRERERDE